MPNANCWSCILSIGGLHNPQGNRNEPLGSCQNCHSLACGHHGHRDPNIPEFICVECDPNLLASSAAMMTTAATTAAHEDVLELLRAAYHLYSIIPIERWRIRSGEDFLRRRPGYASRFVEDASRHRINFTQNWNDNALRDALATLSPDAQEILVLAVLIIRMFEFRRSEVAEFLHEIVEYLESV